MGSCVQLDSLTETPQIPPSPRIWARYTRALFVSHDRRHLCVTAWQHWTLPCSLFRPPGSIQHLRHRDRRPSTTSYYVLKESLFEVSTDQQGPILYGQHNRLLQPSRTLLKRTSTCPDQHFDQSKYIKLSSDTNIQLRLNNALHFSEGS